MCAEPRVLGNAIEEMLRFDPSILIWRRKTKVAVRFQDVDIPAGEDLLLAIGSANRDDAVFESPETFDIRRPNAREHLSFGMGNHLCLLVNLDGARWLADVGFGGSLAEPLHLDIIERRDPSYTLGLRRETHEGRSSSSEGRLRVKVPILWLVACRP